MNICQLRDRLTNIIDDNEQRWPERNSSDVVVNIQLSKRVVEYRKTAQFMSGCEYSLSNGKHYFVIETDDAPVAVYGKNRKEGK